MLNDGAPPAAGTARRTRTNPRPREEATMTSTLRMEFVALLAAFAFLGAVVIGVF